MAHAEGTSTIDRPVNIVFDFIADGLNNPLWRSSVADLQRIPGKPQGVGAVYKQGLKGPGGGRAGRDPALHDAAAQPAVYGDHPRPQAVRPGR